MRHCEDEQLIAGHGVDDGVGEARELSRPYGAKDDVPSQRRRACFRNQCLHLLPEILREPQVDVSIELNRLPEFRGSVGVVDDTASHTSS